MTTELKLNIWTDGACKKNPGPGGWGVLMRWGERTKEMCGGSVMTTNNQMELTAVIEALKAIRRPCQIVLHLDSSYVKDGITSWIHNWKKHGWLTAAKKPVKNAAVPPNRALPQKNLRKIFGKVTISVIYSVL